MLNKIKHHLFKIGFKKVEFDRNELFKMNNK